MEQGNVTKAVSIVLHYYDKSYKYGLSKREKSNIQIIKVEEDDLPKIAFLISGKTLDTNSKPHAW